MAFDHKKIESKWQEKWKENHCFKATIDLNRPKFYALSMFPYPSGSGLHVGHLASYMPTEIVARYKRTRGFNVLHPMGYDAFGLPAEQYAIRTGIHPSVITEQAIVNYRQQLQSFGYSFDWDREISTCDPSFYKWTQWIFIQLFHKNLAYQKKTPVNWCPQLRTILANEEVVDGKSERGDYPVIRKPVEQWLLKITKYADQLLEGLKTLDWPDRTIEGQRNWIGKSQGARLSFPVKNSKETIEIFTTRPDTIFGVTFMVLAPENPLAIALASAEQKSVVLEYQKHTQSISDVERKTAKNKTGVFTGAYAIHPFTKQAVPIWTADYVLMEYGTGAIMAVPAHDERDFEFAKTFNLPIKKIMEGKSLPFIGNTHHIDSDFLNGIAGSAAIQKTIQKLEETKQGKKEIQYKLKDWIFSRQRYWGEPFPLVHFEKVQAVSLDELPVQLPSTVHYEPSEKGEPPLARQSEFIRYTDPKTGQVGRRDSNTMPGYAASSWYFLRYTDPHNNQTLFDFEKQKYWMPVDLYIGGAEHTVGHLLYARFWQRFLYSLKLVSHPEPFTKLIHQGTVLGVDGQKMSKSRGNTVSADMLKEKYGADAVRVFIVFIGPLEKDKPWSSQGIEGCRRFLERIWRLCFDETGQMLPEQGHVTNAIKVLYNKTVKKVTEDIESLNFNTAISAMMILVNELYRKNIRNHQMLKALSQLLMPFAPHIAEEIWSGLEGEGFVSLQPWPQWETKKATTEPLILGAQVNGKTRGSFMYSLGMSESEAVRAACQKKSVQNALKGQAIKKVIYKPGRILNIITQ